MDYGGTMASAILTTASTATAFESGDPRIVGVTIAINAAILIANAAVEIYRKFRDRDKDLQNEKKKTDGEDKTE